MSHTAYVFGEIAPLQASTQPLFSGSRTGKDVPSGGGGRGLTALPSFSRLQLGSRFPSGGGFNIRDTQQFALMTQGRASMPSVSRDQLTLTSHRFVVVRQHAHPVFHNVYVVGISVLNDRDGDKRKARILLK